MFGLRRRLTIGLGSFLLLILLQDMMNISELSKLGGSIDLILRENYQSVLACTKMEEALSNIDRGVLLVMAGSDTDGRAAVAANAQAFSEAMSVELSNITLPGEGDLARKLADLYHAYIREVGTTLAIAPPASGMRQAYASRLRPLSEEIAATAKEISAMNQKNMSQADGRARSEAASAKREMIFLLIAALAAGVGFVVLAGRWVLKPVEALTKSAAEIAKGNLDLVITRRSQDEIGKLSESFNVMAENLREARRTGEARLARVQRATQQALMNLPEAVAVLDLSGNVDVASNAAAETFLLKPGASILKAEPKALAELFESALKEERPGSWRDEPIQHFVRGEERFFRPKAVPIPGPDRRPSGVLLVIEDVTQWRQQEEMKRGVIATVSHQLRTPLTSVRMALHLLLEEKVGPLNHRQIDLLLAAREDGDRLHVMLEELLDMSRLQSGRSSVELTPARPEELAEEAMEPFRSAAMDRGVKLESDIPPDLPDVNADAARIKHVFGNLLANALKYTAPGGSVKVSARLDGDKVRFLVSDTGKGIAPEALPRVFEAFYRPQGDGEAGSGLGLAIVKEVVEAHHGSVQAESRQGEGSTFSFTLPVSTREEH